MSLCLDLLCKMRKVQLSGLPVSLSGLKGSDSIVTRQHARKCFIQNQMGNILEHWSPESIQWSGVKFSYI